MIPFVPKVKLRRPVGVASELVGASHPWLQNVSVLDRDLAKMVYTRSLRRTRNLYAIVPNLAATVTEKLETKWEGRGETRIPVKHYYVVSSLAAKGVWTAEWDYDLNWEGVNQPVADDLFDYKGSDAPDYVGIYDNSLDPKHPILICWYVSRRPCT